MKLGSIELYRRDIRGLVAELKRGPKYEEARGDMRVAHAQYKLRIELLNAISKAALADKQLEDIAALQRKMRELEAALDEKQGIGEHTRHHQRARLAPDESARAVLSDEPLH